MILEILIVAACTFAVTITIVIHVCICCCYKRLKRKDESSIKTDEM